MFSLLDFSGITPYRSFLSLAKARGKKGRRHPELKSDSLQADMTNTRGGCEEANLKGGMNRCVLRLCSTPLHKFVVRYPVRALKGCYGGSQGVGGQ